MAYEEEKVIREQDKAKKKALFSKVKKEDNKFGGKTAEYWVSYGTGIFQQSRDYRSYYYDKQWMINWVYYLGLTNLKYNVKTGQLDWDEKDPLKYNVNEIYAIVRAVRGAVTRYQPQWDVDAYPYGKITEPELKLIGNFLSQLWQKLGMKKKIKETVLYGMACGAGIVQYGFDDMADDGEGELWVDVLDSYDVYVDANCSGDLDKARYVIKTVKRPTDEIENDPAYFNNKDLASDNKVSPSEYKQMLESKINPQYNSSVDMGTTMIYEIWCRDSKREDKINIITILPEQKRLIGFQETDLDEFQFEAYQPDINPNRFYGEGWIKNLVPLQRALNYLERNALEYNALMSKGRFVTTPNSGVKIITNENGQIIKKNLNTQFEQLDMKPLSSTVWTQASNIMKYMQDIGASNEAFMGRAPTGVTSGVALETLVANNMVNLADLTDNLEIFLGRLGTKLLRLGYENYSTTKEFKVKDDKGVFKTVKIVGKIGQEMGLADNNVEDVVALPENPQVRVVINSGLAFTKSGKQENLLKLRAGGDIDRRTLLEEMGGFDPDKIEARLVEERAGQPISENGAPVGEMQTAQMGQEAQQVQGTQPNPIVGMDAGQLATFMQEKGLQLDQSFYDDPQLLQALLEGNLPFDIINNVIVPMPQGQQVA